MKSLRLTISIFLVVIFGAVSIFAQTKATSENNSSLKGFWKGEITREGKVWRVNLDIKQTAENYTAYADFVDVDAFGIEFSVKQTVKFSGLKDRSQTEKPLFLKEKSKNNTFNGNWTGTNTKAVFSLQRADAPPKFYHEEEVIFKNGDVTLSGTLLLPKKSNNFPAVVLTHGSGPATRSTYKSWGLKFVEKGIAALDLRQTRKRKIYRRMAHRKYE